MKRLPDSVAAVFEEQVLPGTVDEVISSVLASYLLLEQSGFAKIIFVGKKVLTFSMRYIVGIVCRFVYSLPFMIGHLSILCTMVLLKIMTVDRIS